MNHAVSLQRLVTALVAGFGAVAVGIALVNPYRLTSLAVLIAVVGVLSMPLLLRWYHPMLVITWNAWLAVPFLPSKMQLWTAIALGGALVVALNATLLGHKGGRLRVPAVEMPLILLFVVVMVTMWASGGMGSRLTGSQLWGATKYLSILGAIIGYFVLVSRPIPLQYGRRMTVIFFLAAITAAGSTLTYILGPKFYALLAVFPVELLAHQFNDTLMLRYSGAAFTSRAVLFAMLAAYGIRGLLDLHHPWRISLALVTFLVGLLGGYRSYVIYLVLVLIVQAYLERLHTTRLMIFAVLGAVLLGGFLVVSVQRLPLSVQRTLSFLPLDIDHRARQDAEGSLDWRYSMWRTAAKEVPSHLLMGKGYSFSGIDYELTQEAWRRGIIKSSYEATLIEGAYHNGILTLVIPLGLPGAFAFFWFALAGFGVLYRNFKHGPPELHTANTLLLSIYAARMVFYLVLYGQFELDLPLFVGLVGLSISLNGGVRGDRNGHTTSMNPPDSIPQHGV